MFRLEKTSKMEPKFSQDAIYIIVYIAIIYYNYQLLQKQFYVPFLLLA